MSFYTKYIELCARDNRSPSYVAEHIGATRASVTRWKNGTIPTETTICKLSHYFGVSPQYFLDADSTELTPLVTELKTTEQAKKESTIVTDDASKRMEFVKAILELPEDKLEVLISVLNSMR